MGIFGRLKSTILFSIVALGLAGCKRGGGSGGADVSLGNPIENDAAAIEQMYFPGDANDSWFGVDPIRLGWDTSATNELFEFLKINNSTGFLIIYKGRIVIEKYWSDWNGNTQGDIASAGKSYASLMAGKLIAEGLIDPNRTVTSYLGNGWSNSAVTNENIVTVYQLMTMTSGLNELLVKKFSPGTDWLYSTNAYKVIFKVIETVTGHDSSQELAMLFGESIGLSATSIDNKHAFRASTRDMARFGLLVLNLGKWNSDQLIPSSYMDQALQTSQSFNLSYGLLFWLNGKSSKMLPGDPVIYPGDIVPAAPNDMVGAMGFGDRRIYVIRSRNLVVVRQGDSSTYGQNLALSEFDNELWKRISTLIH